jgi:hypothetical protein
MVVDTSKSAGERLYNHASLKQKKLEKARTKANEHTPKLILRSKETYGEEERDVTDSPRYLKLYEDAKNRKHSHEAQENEEKRKIPSNTRHEGCERLYSLSTAKQMKGKQRREEIERSKIPPPPTEFKKIPLSQATKMYERSMKHLISKEMKLIDTAHELQIKYESVLIPDSTANLTT